MFIAPARACDLDSAIKAQQRPRGDTATGNNEGCRMRLTTKTNLRDAGAHGLRRERGAVLPQT